MYMCSTQSRNLHSLKIALHILRIWKLRANPILYLLSMRTYPGPYQYAVLLAYIYGVIVFIPQLCCFSFVSKTCSRLNISHITEFFYFSHLSASGKQAWLITDIIELHFSHFHWSHRSSVEQFPSPPLPHNVHHLHSYTSWDQLLWNCTVLVVIHWSLELPFYMSDTLTGRTFSNNLHQLLHQSTSSITYAYLPHSVGHAMKCYVCVCMFGTSDWKNEKWSSWKYTYHYVGYDPA